MPGLPPVSLEEFIKPPTRNQHRWMARQRKFAEAEAAKAAAAKAGQNAEEGAEQVILEPASVDKDPLLAKIQMLERREAKTEKNRELALELSWDPDATKTGLDAEIQQLRAERNAGKSPLDKLLAAKEKSKRSSRRSTNPKSPLRRPKQLSKLLIRPSRRQSVSRQLQLQHWPKLLQKLKPWH